MKKKEKVYQLNIFGEPEEVKPVRKKAEKKVSEFDSETMRKKAAKKVAERDRVEAEWRKRGVTQGTFDFGECIDRAVHDSIHEWIERH